MLQYGKQVEILTLKMFIKALTTDINKLEVVKKDKVKREKSEKLLAESFLLLSEIVSDRTSLSREALLTGFSIVPSHQMLEMIRQCAKHSGLDKISDDDNVDDPEVSDDSTAVSSGLHCRVAAAGSFSRSKPTSKDCEVKTAEQMFSSINTNLNINSFLEDLSGNLKTKQFGRAQTKLRTQTKKKKKFRNLEGLLAIQVNFNI